MANIAFSTPPFCRKSTGEKSEMRRQPFNPACLPTWNIGFDAGFILKWSIYEPATLPNLVAAVRLSPNWLKDFT
jgi:hypothetical protein